MLGLFFERLNNRLKKPDEIPKEDPPSTPKSITKDHSPNKYLNQTTISSNIQTNLSNHYPLQIPITSVSEDLSKFLEQKKMRNPSPIHPKMLQEEQDPLQGTTPRGNKNNVTYGPTGHSKGIFRVDNYRKGPDFGSRNVQKEPMRNHMESILQESVKEGSFLAQNIPSSKLTTASKFNLGEKVNGRHGLQGGKNKFLVESMDQKDLLRKEEEAEQERQEKSETQLHRAWQGWWNEKKKNSVLLLEASKLNQYEMCRQLLDKSKGDLRGDANYKGENGWTPLHYACLNGNINLVNLFLYNGAHTDAETTLKYTVLHLAAQKGHADIFHLLVNSGADFNATDMFNNTPLHYAVQSGNRNIVAMLLSRPSADLNIRNNDNQLAYDLVQNREIKKLFETFMAERNLLSAKTITKPNLQAFKPMNKRKMFEIVNKDYDDAKQREINRNIQTKPQSKRNDEFDIEDRRVFSHRSNITGETKANSSLNTTESDNGNVSAEDEKVGPQSFKVHGLIGKGSFGEVYLVEKKNTGVKYAMKVLHKSMMNKHNLINYAMTERNVLGVTNHSFIVKLNFAFQTPEKLFLILDYCPGGDLGEHLQREKRFSEEKARVYIAEVVLALEDLHKRDIIFRDLKPDNIVLDAEGHIKLTDFGLSKEGVLDHLQGARSFCGSVAYLAPEMLRRTGHGKAVDWYLLGVVFYEMLVGIPPYYANNREELFYNIDKAPLKVPSHLSMEAKSLLKGLLQRNPAKRLGSGKVDAGEIKAHEFFRGIDWKDVEQRKLTPPLVEKKMNVVDKVTYDVFEIDPNVPEDAGKVEGWSFVAPQVEQTLDKKLF